MWKTFDTDLYDRSFPVFNRTNGQIRVDVKDRGDEYLVEAEVPGFSKDEISVEVVEDRLTISAKKEELMDEKNENYLRRENYQTVSRSFVVPDIVSEKATAKFENGLLSIVLPKKTSLKEKAGKSISSRLRWLSCQLLLTSGSPTACFADSLPPRLGVLYFYIRGAKMRKQTRQWLRTI